MSGGPAWGDGVGPGEGKDGLARGLVFNVQKFSVEDGPGIRTTVFLKGCPLACAWCHNPEGLSPEREVWRNAGRCLGCGACRQACAFGRASGESGPLPVQVDGCTQCGACVEACPTGARQVAGRILGVEEVMAEVLADRMFYEESSGGVTFSGGEPLRQPAFLRALLSACRRQGLHTAVDTSGFACTDDLLGVAGLTSLFLYDVKLMDEGLHRRYTGVSNRPILENLRALDAVHDRYWLRVPLVPGVTDTEENLEAIGQLAASLHGVRQVNVLPYHRAGREKYPRLERSMPSATWRPPPPERVVWAVEKLARFGVPVVAGGGRCPSPRGPAAVAAEAPTV